MVYARAGFAVRNGRAGIRTACHGGGAPDRCHSDTGSGSQYRARAAADRRLGRHSRAGGCRRRSRDVAFRYRQPGDAVGLSSHPRELRDGRLAAVRSANRAMQANPGYRPAGRGRSGVHVRLCDGHLLCAEQIRLGGAGKLWHRLPDIGRPAGARDGHWPRDRRDRRTKFRRRKVRPGDRDLQERCDHLHGIVGRDHRFYSMEAGLAAIRIHR